MQKKIGPKIILIAFLSIICFSWIFWIFLEKYVDTTNYENRERAEQPRLTIDNYETFANDYDEWFNDNIPFRNNLITLNSAVDYFVFNRSANKKVIVGKDDWLFYNGVEDGNPIECYQGTNLLSQKELEDIAKNCITQRNFLQEQGKEFVIFIAPNKERVYYEYMPEQYGVPADEYKALQVYNYLKKNTDLRVVYPYEELMEMKQSIGVNIYFKTDTHWNYIGGYTGARVLLKELGIDMPSLVSDEMNIITQEKSDGDLAKMLGLSKQLRNIDLDYLVSGYDDHEMECLEYDTRDAYSYKAMNADPRKIYVVRDSFATFMAPFIGSQFSEATLKHRDKYSYEDYQEKNPDVVVYEVVERYVDVLEYMKIK